MARSRTYERDDTHDQLVVAIRSQNPYMIRTAAAALASIGEPVPLDLAIMILAVIAEREPETFDRAAVRWLGRLCTEVSITLADLDRALEIMEAVPTAEDKATTARDLRVLVRRP